MTELRSPLSPESIWSIAIQIDGGDGPPLSALSYEDRIAILAAVVRLREQRAVEAMLREAVANPVVADRLLTRDETRGLRLDRHRRGVGRVDDLVARILLSTEGLLLLNLLAALVSIPTSAITGQPVVIAFLPGLPFGAISGWRSTDSGQAYCLRRYLDWKLSGQTDDDPPPFGGQLRPALRAWANTLEPTEARGWVDNGLPAIPAVEEAGTRIQAVYTRHLDRLGVSVDGVFPGQPWGLPIEAAPLPSEVVERLMPRMAPKPENGQRFGWTT